VRGGRKLVGTCRNSTVPGQTSQNLPSTLHKFDLFAFAGFCQAFNLRNSVSNGYLPCIYSLPRQTIFNLIIHIVKFLLTTGRIFFGICIAGLGVFHFLYPGIRPIIIPGLTNIPSGLYWTVYLTALLLITTGLLIIIGKKYHSLCLIMGLIFLGLFLFGHLPAFLSAAPPNSSLWVNLNKILALSGGFFLISTINAPRPEHPALISLYKLAPIGMYLFAIMLYNFSVGHMVNMNGVSTLVPKYIPFPKFWTFIGGIALMGSAISIFTGYKTRKIMLLLATVLFIWLLSLHFYYAVRFPKWNDGENFIGVITCMAFCGIALIISQRGNDNTPAKRGIT
jgi:hypothetical protein